MELFSDERSIPKLLRDKIQSINLIYSLDTDGIRKTYPTLSDRLYYAVGDSYIASRNHKSLKVFGSEADSFDKIGFSRAGKRHKATKTSLLRERERNYTNIIGVEPNGLRRLADSLETHTLYDPYIYPATGSVVDDFVEHCATRWSLQIPTTVMDLVAGQVDLIRSAGGLERNTTIFEEIPVVSGSFDSITAGPADVTVTQSGIQQSGVIFGPVISKAVESPREKNRFRSIGLIMTHDTYFLIGESPGTHYLSYPKMTSSNTDFWDPRKTNLPYRQVNKLFTRQDIGPLVERAQTALSQGRKPLLLIDIRRDKPDMTTASGMNEWEQMVQSDNELICELVNALPLDVTVCAKIRPAYGPSFVMPRLTRKVRMLPLPYLKRTTAEFNMFAPSTLLINGNEKTNWSYDDLTTMAEEVFVLKSIIGSLYNLFLMDQHLNLGVRARATELVDDCSALWSISNIINSRSNIDLYLRKGSRFTIAMPYADVLTSTIDVTTRNRRYTDHAFNSFDEVRLRPDVWLVPLYAINGASDVTAHDFRNCVLTDDANITQFTQPDTLISTQIVKLVSFALKDSFADKGLDWTAIDKTIRSAAIENLSGRKEFAITKTTNGDYIVNGRMVTVSGHMLYILLGSVLGVPYGLKKYLREIEVNIISPGQSYERRVGGRIWHGLLSHYLAIDCVIDIVDGYMRMDYYDRTRLLQVTEYMKRELLKLGAKYETYLNVDERDKIPF
ncbi:VP3 [Banna-like virus strain Balaton/2010/HUN]|nr:VP3 [Banna-like virus strain Balaton/2010/HUN]